MDPATIPTYRVFYNQAEAETFANRLQKLGVSCAVVEDSVVMDQNIIGVASDTLFRVKVMQGDFGRANALLFEEASKEITSVPDGHYLVDFTNEELRDVIAKPFEWSAGDRVIAGMILNTRGSEPEPVRESYDGPEFQPRVWTTKQLAMAYATLLILGLGGFVIGLTMWRAKKTLPNGRIIFSNSETDRNHGIVLFILGILIVLATFNGAILKYS